MHGDHPAACWCARGPSPGGPLHLSPSHSCILASEPPVATCNWGAQAGAQLLGHKLGGQGWRSCRNVPTALPPDHGDSERGGRRSKSFGALKRRVAALRPHAGDVSFAQFVPSKMTGLGEAGEPRNNPAGSQWVGGRGPRAPAPGFTLQGVKTKLGHLGHNRPSVPLDHGRWPTAIPSLGNLRALPVPPASPACTTLGNPLPPAGRMGWRKDAFFRTGRDRKALLPARFLPSHLLFPINGEKKPSASAPRSSQCSSQGRLSTSQEKKGEFKPAGQRKTPSLFSKGKQRGWGE